MRHVAKPSVHRQPTWHNATVGRGMFSMFSKIAWVFKAPMKGCYLEYVLVQLLRVRSSLCDVGGSDETGPVLEVGMSSPSAMVGQKRFR